MTSSSRSDRAALPAESRSIWFDGVAGDGPTHRSDIPSTVDCVVIGAGIAGLATAARLLEHDVTVAVVEARSVAGGVCVVEVAGVDI
ncbi:MAG: FAD-dependent oxidoreductase, partial [Acidimicrobiales bacterium]|nr:FAD-dependent oxidoreductase [Acidimicrobiales bacterium]